MAADVVDDSALLTAVAQRRDRIAYETLFERYGKDAYNLALRLTRKPALAEEAVQEAMLFVWQHAEKFDASRNPRNWILSVVARRSLESGRSSKRSQRREKVRGDMDPKKIEDTPSAVEQREMLANVRNRVDQLPDVDRQLVVLYYGAGMKQGEIAGMLGISRLSVLRKIQDALKRLRTELSADGFAAATPLLTMEGLGEALTSFDEVPTGLREKVMSQLTGSASQSIRAFSRNTVKASERGSAGLAIGALAIVTAGVVGWWAATSGPRAPAPPVLAPPVAATEAPAPQAVPVATPAAPVEFSRRWTFENGSPAELTVIQGTWIWKKDKAAMEGMRCAILLPQTLPEVPIKISAKMRYVDITKRVGSGVKFCKDRNEVKAERHWLKPDVKLDRSALANESYLIGPYVVDIINGQIASVALYIGSREGWLATLTVNEVDVYEIEMKTIKESEIPLKLRKPELLTKTMHAIK